MKPKKKKFRFFTGHIRPGQWVDLESIKNNGHYIADLFSNFSLSNKKLNYDNERFNSFEDYLEKNNIPEDEIQLTKSNSLKLCYFFGTVTILSILFLIYCLFHASVNPNFFPTLIIGLTITLLAGCYTWREHFIYTKIKYRQLYLTPMQWLMLLFQKQKK